MDGIVNFLKPTGLTSSDAVGRVRRIFSRRDVGHMGTLDPFGSGVLCIGLGKATRLFDLFSQNKKTYRATFAFGYSSDTLDSSGKWIKEGAVPSVGQILEVLPRLMGETDQMPPDYSAKKIGGRPAYDLAREGKAFTLTPKRVTIFAITLFDSPAQNQFTFDFTVSAGTYIRSICRDMAALLGTSALMTSIIRLSSGAFTLADSVTENELSQRGHSAVIETEQALRLLGVPRVDADAALKKNIANGVSVALPQAPVDVAFALYCDGALYGVAKAENSGETKLTAFLKV